MVGGAPLRMRGSVGRTKRFPGNASPSVKTRLACPSVCDVFTHSCAQFGGDTIIVPSLYCAVFTWTPPSAPNRCVTSGLPITGMNASSVRSWMWR